MLRILMVDDDTALSAMLVEYFAAEGFQMDARTNGADGVLAALSGQYAAVLLDIMMPEMSGIEVLREVRQKSQIPIIMLTAKGDDVERVVGLEMGADDYISKPFYSRELLARLKAVLRRTSSGSGAPVPQSVAAGDLSLLPGRRSATWRGESLALTATEFNLLELLVGAGGDLVSKDDLSQKALGRRRESYDRSVDVHIGNLRQKVTAASGGEIEIKTIRGVGYSLEIRS